MISLKSSLKICTKIHGNSVFHLFGATLPFRQVSDKRLIRKPLKKFKPTTSMKHLEELEEDDFYESQLKQARRIADVSHELIVPKSRRKEPVKLATSEKKIEKDPVQIDEKPEADDFLPKDFDRSTLPKYENILGWDKQNPLLRKLKQKFCLTLTPSKSANEGLIVLEGKRLIIEALQAGAKPDTFIFSRLNLLSEFPLDKLQDCQVVQIPYKNISAWSELKTSPGFMATFRKSDIEAIASKISDSLPIYLILDNIRMPENVGSLLRLAAGAGCKQVIAMSGCANIWNPKALRSGSGAHLKVPIKSNVTWDVIHRFVPQNTQVVIADLLASTDHFADENLPNGRLAEKLRELDLKAKTFKYQDSKTEANDFRDNSYLEEELLKEYRSVPLSTQPYNKLELCCSFPGSKPLRIENDFELVIVIGGETDGVSAAAYKFAHNNHGEKVFIPLRNGVESLNAARDQCYKTFFTQYMVT